MKGLFFHSEIWLPRPIAEIFPFFGNARNLEIIIPPWLQPKTTTLRGGFQSLRMSTHLDSPASPPRGWLPTIRFRWSIMLRNAKSPWNAFAPLLPSSAQLIRQEAKLVDN